MSSELAKQFASGLGLVVDVSEIAQRFGGGGHKNAAGFTVPDRVDIGADYVEVG